ncbi:DivIVA domain-containing protein [Kineosporia sp. J2-2]|uniref:DivIVA domain-containing protein n=1 Tax=Kineosporia corallincola TaxID=2835133 RepID=A0ABS5TK16_9ACTN|nr:DivIVA domain-containing protein [Kineosporia corallincola]MBT0770413.1 DivIVA domain-containing protein [Kineosporia corallincola]
MTLLMVLLTLVVVAGVIAVATGVIRGGLDEPAPTIPVRALPADDITGRDVTALRFVQGFRGYRMDQVDAALDSLALEVDRLRAQVVQERSARLQLARGGAVTTTGEGVATIDAPPVDEGGVPAPDPAYPLTGPITRPLRRPRRRAENPDDASPGAQGTAGGPAGPPTTGEIRPGAEDRD